MSACITAEDRQGLETVELAALGVDQSYQRGLRPHHRRIAKSFDTAAVGVLHVNRRPDGSLWVIDGQQRRAAMLLLGLTHWPARVTALATVEDEARLFNRLNGGEGTKKNVGERDRFKALLAARNPTALSLVAAVEAGGLKIRPTGQKAWPYLRCTRLAQGHLEVGGPEVVRRACAAIAAAWPGQDAALYDTVFGGLASLLHRQPGVKDQRLAAKLARVPVMKMVAQANSSVGCRYYAFAKLAADVYNSGLRQGRIEVSQ